VWFFAFGRTPPPVLTTCVCC